MIFCMKMHHGFLQDDSIAFTGHRHAESTQNDKFVISLQNLTKKVSDAIKFLQADKLS